MVRGFILRAQGRERWSDLAKSASHDPTSLKKQVDEFLELERRGRISLPSRDLMVAELLFNSGKYLGMLEQMDAATFVDAIEQHNYMKETLNMNIDGIPEHSRQGNIDTLQQLFAVAVQ